MGIYIIINVSKLLSYTDLGCRYVLGEAGYSHLLDQLPENTALEGLAGALVEAWRLYSVPASVILFLIEDVTYNICDQKFHEFEIRRQCPEVFVIRRTLTDLANRGFLTEVRRRLRSGPSERRVCRTRD